MFKALIQYVPLGPLLMAVLLFLLMPFDGAEKGGGEFVLFELPAGSIS